jgi:hypothetical protein
MFPRLPAFVGIIEVIHGAATTWQGGDGQFLTESPWSKGVLQSPLTAHIVQLADKIALATAQ